MNLELTTRVKRNPDMIAADMKGETVMMSISTGKYHSVNSVGSRIWELLASPSDANQLIESLVSEYDVSKEVCTKEVIEFIETMLKSEVLLLDA